MILINHLLILTNTEHLFILINDLLTLIIHFLILRYHLIVNQFLISINDMIH